MPLFTCSLPASLAASLPPCLPSSLCCLPTPKTGQLANQLQVLRLECRFTHFDPAHYLDNDPFFCKPKEDAALAARVKAVEQQLGPFTVGSKYQRVYDTDAAQSCGLAGLMRQALPQLTALTRLEVEEVADAAVFKYAPAQLLELRAEGVDDESDR